MLPLKERDLHKQVCDYLSVALDGLAWFSTFPSDGAGRRGRIGLKRGVPDILVIDKRACWIELKTARGKETAEQRLCHDELRLAGCPVAVCRSLEEVEAVLQRWGVAMRPGVRITTRAGNPNIPTRSQ